MQPTEISELMIKTHAKPEEEKIYSGLLLSCADALIAGSLKSGTSSEEVKTVLSRISESGLSEGDTYYKELSVMQLPFQKMAGELALSIFERVEAEGIRYNRRTIQLKDILAPKQ